MWNPSVDATSQINWNIRVGSALGKTNIIQAGNWNQAPPEWGAAQLIAKENATAKQYVRHYAHHNYPGGSIQKLQTHSQTASNIRQFDADVAAVKREGKEYVLGETNSGSCPFFSLSFSPPSPPVHPSSLLLITPANSRRGKVSGGGATNVSPTFGAALWTLDYILLSLSHSISRVYFHHGTVGNCQYCFFGRYSMGAPYWGAHTAVSFLAGGKHIAALDDGRSNYAAYAVFDDQGRVSRVLVYNSDYYTGSGNRGKESFVLTGLVDAEGKRVRAKRLTARSALSRADRGDDVRFGGQWFGNGTCVLGGEEVVEEGTVQGGRVQIEVGASEAVLVYL